MKTQAKYHAEPSARTLNVIVEGKITDQRYATQRQGPDRGMIPQRVIGFTAESVKRTTGATGRRPGETQAQATERRRRQAEERQSALALLAQQKANVKAPVTA